MLDGTWLRINEQRLRALSLHEDSMPTDGIKLGLEQRRSMEQALIELRERYKRAPTKTLARMIEQLEAEIAERASQQAGP